MKKKASKKRNRKAQDLTLINLDPLKEKDNALVQYCRGLRLDLDGLFKQVDVIEESLADFLTVIQGHERRLNSLERLSFGEKQSAKRKGSNGRY